MAGQPNEALIDFASSWLKAHGAGVTVAPSTWRADGYNLYAVLGPDDGGGILLAAHTDVVAVDGQRWSSDPFAMRRSEGRLYGRGTADMKGFIAAVLAAISRTDARRLRKPLAIALSCDEELGCKGVPSLLERLAAGPQRPSVCVIGEPTRMRVANRHKGKVTLRVDVKGRACHSSVASRGVNAVTFAARLIGEIDDLPQTWPGGMHDDGFATPHATLSVGPIHGGVSVNIVPDQCTFEVELRYLPGESPGVAIGALRERAETLATSMRKVAPEAAIELTEITSYPPLGADPAGVSAVESLGIDGPPIAVDFGTEAGYYSQQLGVPCVVCGPGDMSVAHRPDEYLEQAQLQAAETFVSRVLEQLAGDPATR